MPAVSKQQGIRWAVAFLFGTALLASSATRPAYAQQQQPAETQLHNLYYGVHFPDDRRLSRRYDLAAELLDEQRYSEAMPLLLEILAAEEDRLYRIRTDRQADFQSLKSKAIDVIQQLGPAGWESYQLTSEAVAKRQLAEALQTGSRDQLAKLIRRFPYSGAAAIAAWELARGAAEESNHERALGWLRVVQANARHAADFEPQASISTAVSQVALGDVESARAALQSVDNGDQILATIANANAQNLATEPGWLGIGGDRRHSKQVAGEEPHLWSHWQSRLVGSLSAEQQYTALAQSRARNHQPMIPAVSPIAVGDTLVTRTNRRLVAIDWHSGRRVWQTRPESQALSNRAQLHSLPSLIESSQTELLGASLWLNTVATGLSSDGQLVFAVHNDNSTEQLTLRALRGGPRARQRGSLTPLTNRLSAYDPRLQGKLIWSLQGGAKGPWLGAFFLCPPLAIDGRLLVMAEMQQTIVLAELDAQTGNLLWKQPLAAVEAEIGNSPVRRLTGGAIASVNEHAICSTGVGAVIAVDLARRSLKWVSRLPVGSRRRVSRPHRWGGRQEHLQLIDSRRRWLENRLAIVGDRILVACPESNQLHSIDVNSGELQWSVPREDGLLLVAATPEMCLVTANHSILAFSSKTGKTLWRERLPNGTAIVGRSLLVDRELLAPLDDGNLFAVDIHDRTKRTLSTWDGNVGNLIYHRGAVVSQSLVSVDRFDQRNSLRSLASPTEPSSTPEEPPSSNDRSDPIAALITQGESALSAGDWEQGIQLLRQACSASPRNARAATRLQTALQLAAKKRPLSDQEVADVLGLASTNDQRLEILACITRDAVKRHDPQSALAFAEDFLSDPREQNAAAMQISPSYWAKPSRLLAGSVGDIWSELDPQQTTTWEDRLGVHQNLGKLSLTELRRRRQLLAATPYAVPFGAELATRYLDRDEFSLAQAEQAKLPAAVGTPEEPYQPSPWAYRQTKVTTTKHSEGTSSSRRSRRTVPMTGWLTLPVQPVGEGSAPSMLYSLGANGEAVQGFDQYGTKLFEIDIPMVGEDLTSQLRASRTTGLATVTPRPLAWRVGGQLILAGKSDVVGVDLLAARQGDTPPIWLAKQTLKRATNRSRREPTHHGVQANTSSSPLPSRWKGVGVSAGGVLVRGPGAIACLNPMSGEPNWIRTDLRADSATILIDRQYAYLQQASSSSRVRLLDGRQDAAWQGPDGSWVALHSQILTTRQRQGDRVLLQMVHVDTGQQIYRKQFTRPNLLRVEKSKELLVVEAVDDQMRLTAIDLTNGKESLSTSVEASHRFSYFQAQRRPFGLLVVMGHAPRQIGRVNDPSPVEIGPLINGSLLCFDTNRNEMRWRAEIADYELIDRTPHECPLVLLGNRHQRKGSSSSRVQANLLALDGATGRSVFQLDNLRDSTANSFRVRYDAGPDPAIRARFSNSVTEVRLTKQGLPPGASYRGQVESPSELSLAKWWQSRRGFNSSKLWSPPTAPNNRFEQADDE